jgi:hypothetical protein
MSPWTQAVQVLKAAFTGPIATGLALVAIVVGDLMFAFTDVTANPLDLGPHLMVPSLECLPIDLQKKFHLQGAHPGAKFRVVAVSAIRQDRCRRNAIAPRWAPKEVK